MARGKLLKTKIKEAVLQASLVAESIQLGKEKATQKLNAKKPMDTAIFERLEKLLDNIDPLEGAVYGAVAYTGYHATNDWRGAVLGIVSLKLATSPSEAAAISGIIGLVSLGLAEGVFNIEHPKTEVDGYGIEELENFISNPPLGAKIHPVMIYYAENRLAELRRAEAEAGGSPGAGAR